MAHRKKDEHDARRVWEKFIVCTLPIIDILKSRKYNIIIAAPRRDTESYLYYEH